MSLEKQLFQSWLLQLKTWAAEGHLVSAGVDALGLKPGQATDQLNRIANRLAKGDTRDLPPIEVLPGSSIRGAAGAYAKSTGRIYLNNNWLKAANKNDVLFVLSAELGHHLDAQLNREDTPGDEGNTFASLLVKNQQKQPFNSQSGEQEHGLVFTNNQWIKAEFESWIGNTGGDNYPNAVDGDDNSGDDNLTGNSGNDTINGGAGNDTIRGKNGNDSIDGGDGNDFIEGGDGEKHNDGDTINGGDGNDIIYGHTSTDIQGGKTPDSIDGGAGNDTIIADRKNDTLVGGIGDDSIEGNWGHDQIWGDVKNQDNGVLDGNDTLLGGSGNDTIYGGGGQDSINGGSGNDNLVGESGNDTIDGGDGTDIAVFNGNRSDYTLTYSNPSGALNSNSITVNGTDGTDVITNIETLRFDDQDINSPDVPTVQSVSSSTADGTYKAGDVITINVVFSEAVTVTTTGGTPQLNLETGSTDQTASYSSGTGTNTLAFSYTVQAGDSSTDLNYKTTSSLALSGGTIQDAAGNNATLTLPALASGDSLAGNSALVIDTTKSSDAPCFTSNSCILLENGTEQLVQNLKQGDRVVTRSGIREILWIGRKHFSQSQLKLNRRNSPIAFLQNSLGDNIPAKTLCVSEGHYFYINGMLIAAGCLVNGINIIRVSPDSLRNGVCYWHIDLGGEQLVKSNSCWTGSYYCWFNRRGFSNYLDFDGDPDQCTKQLDLPRFTSIHDIKEDYKYLVKRALVLEKDQCSLASS